MSSLNLDYQIYIPNKNMFTELDLIGEPYPANPLITKPYLETFEDMLTRVFFEEMRGNEFEMQNPHKQLRAERIKKQSPIDAASQARMITIHQDQMRNLTPQQFHMQIPSPIYTSFYPPALTKKRKLEEWEENELEPLQKKQKQEIHFKNEVKSQMITADGQPFSFPKIRRTHRKPGTGIGVDQRAIFLDNCLPVDEKEWSDLKSKAIESLKQHSYYYNLLREKATSKYKISEEFINNLEPNVNWRIFLIWFKDQMRTRNQIASRILELLWSINGEIAKEDIENSENSNVKIKNCNLSSWRPFTQFIYNITSSKTIEKQSQYNNKWVLSFEKGLTLDVKHFNHP